MTSSLVWISGASSGIGAALVRTVPWEDARIIDLSRGGGDAAPEAPAGRAGREGTEHVVADLSRPEGWQAAASSFQRELAGFVGDRAVFVHCAATLDPMGFAGEVEPEGYTSQVVLNSAAPQVLGDAFIRAVEANGGVDAHLVQITSGAATSVCEGWSAYGPGKAAADHWVRIAGAERARRGSRCRVIAVAPGVVATPMQERIRETAEHDFPDVERFVELHANDQLRDPNEAARGIWSLLERDLDNGAVVDLRELE
ncbi:MAG: SDR family NAD(P)-dependent oxidoreductase [Nitriliruptorales bacterium]